MSTKTLHRSFAGGEITPELYGRLDLTKYQTGLALCLNFVVLPHGPVTRRPGLRFITEARDSTRRVRLLPFAFSATQTVVLEFGHLYARFHIGGQTLLESNVAIASIAGSTVNTASAHGYSTGDDVFIGTRFHRITVVDADTFTTADRWGNPTTASGANAARVYTIATPYVEADLFDLHFAQDNDIFTITHPGYAARELRRVGATNWTLTTISFAAPPGPVSAPAVIPTTPTSGAGVDNFYAYTVTGADGVESLPSPTTAAVVNPLNLAGNFNTISWISVPGALRYTVYKLRGGVLGYIGSTTGLNLRDDNIIPDTTQAPPEAVYALNAAAGDYPTAVTYHEQRRWFAGTLNDPQTITATRNGTQSNLTSSTPVRDDDALEFRIASRQQNAIRHLLPLADLIAMTVGGEFRIYSDNAPNITPTSLSIKPQGYSGASNVQPALTNGSILYVQSQGSRVREMAYNWQTNAYSSIDLSIMAPHLFNGFTVADMTYSRAPVPILWAVRSDGVLLGMTYVPEQQVYAWHRHTTDGSVESVTVVSEGFEDVLYVLVRRTVGGRSVRYIERLQTTVFVEQADAFFVDSGLTYRGAPVTSLTGLWHLEGKTVQILADGADIPEQVVTGGSITLPEAASVVHVGLPYASDFTTLPLAFEGAPAAGQGRTKNVNGVAMRATQSSLVQAGPNFNKLTDYPARQVSDPYGSPPALRTGEFAFSIGPSWNPDGGVCVRQARPVPLTVLSMALDVAVGG
jgi:hypothetical protein